jgi:hypothetical protein
MVRADAEIIADIGEHRAGAAAADLGRDLLWRGQVNDTGIDIFVALLCWWPCAARPAFGGGARARRRGVRAVAAADEPRFERCGAQQRPGDVGEDQPDIGGAEVSRDDDEVFGRGGGALLQRSGESLAVVDELAEDAEEAAGAAGCLRVGDRPILLGIGEAAWAGDGWRCGHERNKNTAGALSQGNFSGKIVASAVAYRRPGIFAAS